MALPYQSPTDLAYAYYLAALYPHLLTNSIQPGSPCGPLSGPTDLAYVHLAFLCHLPTNAAVLGAV